MIHRPLLAALAFSLLASVARCASPAPGPVETGSDSGTGSGSGSSSGSGSGSAGSGSGSSSGSGSAGMGVQFACGKAFCKSSSEVCVYPSGAGCGLARQDGGGSACPTDPSCVSFSCTTCSCIADAGGACNQPYESPASCTGNLSTGINVACTYGP